MTFNKQTGVPDTGTTGHIEVHPNSIEDITNALSKSLPHARLNRVPRHTKRRDIVLAVLCVGMVRRYPYSEWELNAFLQNALSALNARVDHVTCRRYMVDLGFLKRDRAGKRYFLNYPKLAATLPPDAMASIEEIIDVALARQRRRTGARD